MQRVEPRELVAALGSAAIPLGWVLAVGAGWLPDVLDNDAGAGLAYAIGAWRQGDVFVPSVPLAVLVGALSGASPVVAARLAIAGLAWLAGYAAWRLAEPRPAGERVGVVLLAQLGPQATLALWHTDVAALTFGPVLFALAFPRLGWLAGLCGAPAAAAVATIGLLRRRWNMLLAAVGLLVLLTPPVDRPGAALRDASVVSLGPAYGGAGGAWFPMPPQEHARWARASASYGQWVHPRVVEGSGAAASRPTRGNQPGGDGPAAHEAPTGGAALGLAERVSAWFDAAARGTVLEAERRALGVAGMVAPLWGILAWLSILLLGPRGGLPTLALLGSAGGLVLGAREAWHRERDGPRVDGADLASVVSRLDELEPGAVMLFPPPGAPYFAGRVSEDRWRALLLATGREAVTPAALAGALGWRMEYGLDVASAANTWAARDVALPFVDARDAGVRVLVVDTAAAPSFVWDNTEGWIARRLGQPERHGDLALYDLVAGIDAFGGGVGVVDDDAALAPVERDAAPGGVPLTP